MDFLSAGMDLLGGIFGDSDADKQYARQKTFAQNTIRWKTEDAKRAGIHPLYALGAPTLNYSAVTSPMGQAVANAGEKLSRSVSSDYEKKLQAKNLENIQADIDLKNSQSANFIAEAKRSSNLAMATQPGRKAGNPNQIMQKYIKVYNPFTKKNEWMPNPDLGVEYPDTYGSALLLNATAQDNYHPSAEKGVSRSYKSYNNPNPRAYKRAF